ncbi:MAG: SulP family inorganic anion transporter [Chthoniobacterales bacterium]
MSSSSLVRWIPSLTWLRVYNRSWLRGDVLAGIPPAAYLLPAALGDASLANLRPEVGLYARLFGAFTNADQLIALDPRTDCQKRH